MLIVLVNESNFHEALEVYTASWRESHLGICSAEFLQNRDYAGYLRNKLGCLYLASDGEPIGVFCLNGETLGDLYIHPKHQGRGCGTVCVRFALGKSTRLRLSVLSTNVAAIALYKKMGFRFTGNDVLLRDNLWEREMIFDNEYY